MDGEESPEINSLVKATSSPYDVYYLKFSEWPESDRIKINILQ